MQHLKKHIILRAERADAPAILALQCLAYQSEAKIYGAANVPPLSQTLEQLCAEFDTMVILKALAPGGRIIGSVRAVEEEGSGICRIGRLIVHPECQRQGIGSALLYAVEARFPLARRFSLFTGSRSEGNLRLYNRLGYQAVRSQMVGPDLILIFLERARS